MLEYIACTFSIKTTIYSLSNIVSLNLDTSGCVLEITVRYDYIYLFLYGLVLISQVRRLALYW